MLTTRKIFLQCLSLHIYEASVMLEAKPNIARCIHHGGRWPYLICPCLLGGGNFLALCGLYYKHFLMIVSDACTINV